MSKRGNIAAVVLLSVAVVAVLGAVYLVAGKSSTGLVYYSNDIFVPQITNPRHEYYPPQVPPTSRRPMQSYPIYITSYDRPGETRLNMFACQSFCNGRPGNLPRHLYPTKVRGGKEWRGCYRECYEQRWGIKDTVKELQIPSPVQEMPISTQPRPPGKESIGWP